MVRVHRGSPVFVYPGLQTRQTMTCYAINEIFIRPYRLAWSRTPPFHGENRGSNPLRDANLRLRGLILRSRPTATIGYRRQNEAKIVLRSFITHQSFTLKRRMDWLALNHKYQKIKFHLQN